MRSVINYQSIDLSNILCLKTSCSGSRLSRIFKTSFLILPGGRGVSRSDDINISPAVLGLLQGVVPVGRA